MPQEPGGQGRLRRVRVSQEVADDVADLIFSGRLAYPDRIDLDAIAERLGVSRVPVREALRELNRDGLVLTEFYRGATAAPLTAATLQDNFELYGLLTGLAARRVAECGDAEELDSLTKIVAPAGPAPSAAEFIDQSYAFRRTVHRIGASHRLRTLLGSFTTVLTAAGRATGGKRLAERRAALVAEERAITSRDPDGAMRAASANMRLTGQMTIEILARRGVLQESPGELAAGDFYRRAMEGLLGEADR